MPSTALIPSNAFSIVVIEGLAKVNGSNVALTCLKGVSTPGYTHFSTRPDITRSDGVPSRLPSKLPPPDVLCLGLTLQERLGRGRVGSVYSVGLNQPTNSILDSKHSRLPPLVVKIAGEGWSKRLAGEAWFYEEMEYLQGVSIARCYGLFEAELPDGCDILSWPDHRKEDGAGRVKPDLSRVHNVRKIISILVLEKLGGHIPVGVPTDSIEPKVYEVFNDIGRLGVEHLDPRWRNILKAPEISDGLLCRYHGHLHEWRVIDFDCARKTDQESYAVDWSHESWLNAVFDNLQRGHIVDGELDH